MKKIIRMTTVPVSLRILLKGQLRFMSHYFTMIAVSSDADEMKAIAEEEDIMTYAVEMTRTISPFSDIRSVYGLYKIFKKEKPDIVHTHTPKAGIAGMLAAWLAGVPVRLHTVAGLPLMEATGFRRKILNTVESLTYRLATKVYPNSRGLYHFILDSKFTVSDKLKVIGNGSSNGISVKNFDPQLFSDAERSALKEKLNISDAGFLFIFVGRLVGDKGINELIQAYGQVRKADTRLLLVGGFEEDLDPLKKETLQKIREAEDIIPVGFQKDVRPYFAISNALVFPSYREGFPNVVMQAGAMGLPSIVSDINGCNEIIVEGENGIIVPVKDESRLADAMKQMLADPEAYGKMKSNARKMIEERYEQSVIWNELLNEYNRLLKEKHHV